ncbi:hypothetical protein PUN28_017139 [Cardiocondyla obscurior]|uniref:Secreted protein n=1 Tax=Cardiocondyla obscurior TaxID=286306 RepID=A0AAW2EQA5_9HYME
MTRCRAFAGSVQASVAFLRFGGAASRRRRRRRRRRRWRRRWWWWRRQSRDGQARGTVSVPPQSTSSRRNDACVSRFTSGYYGARGDSRVPRAT